MGRHHDMKLKMTVLKKCLSICSCLCSINLKFENLALYGGFYKIHETSVILLYGMQQLYIARAIEVCPTCHNIIIVIINGSDCFMKPSLHKT